MTKSGLWVILGHRLLFSAQKSILIDCINNQMTPEPEQFAGVDSYTREAAAIKADQISRAQTEVTLEEELGERAQNLARKVIKWEFYLRFRLAQADVAVGEHQLIMVIDHDGQRNFAHPALLGSVLRNGARGCLVMVGKKFEKEIQAAVITVGQGPIDPEISIFVNWGERQGLYFFPDQRARYPGVAGTGELAALTGTESEGNENGHDEREETVANALVRFVRETFPGDTSMADQLAAMRKLGTWFENASRS